ncbi:BZ3500_MvSof-1268-A1-R1_Chr7-1g09115 [Microbotryum saponariae]|uniref:NADH dehydrogenase [ubiquinone] 1 beta subcomplex subunit 4 n=1 Tax=Microbotryum saponariae TaxID=289078 RepID=A0A2X0MZQ6_9BASI|nr:BZ3501_MvSof-1269-A2-R1_Chr7-1g08820 [Microbotryum saponariae]SDA02830.1 BZ3500_MvSof-1268-A1-R1_Chr7-1g09115 [Microbotryum saponariae]
MAGGGHGYQPVKIDPAVESWAYMRENVWRHFRFTNRTTRLSLIWGVLVPVAVYAVALRTDLKWDVIGAKKDDPIARWGPMALKPSERAAAAAAAAKGAEDDE